MAKLRVADGLALPADAITQTFGILAKRGAGKTNTAVVMAEEMHRAGLPFVVIDPVDAWWGLRSSADGKGPGLPIPVFGGKHGDVPLERTGGQLLADLVVDERLSCVLSLFEFSEGDKTRFLIDFAERLYRRNEDPLHLFLEEADDYAPQRPFREQARLLRAWENVVRRGRQRGLGITMITQRSAALNKSVLTQIETLVVLRTTSPQDRKAIQAWVEHHGQSLELLESLPGLEDGEAWVWSPHWLKVVKRVRFRLRETFDSAATPKEVRGKRPPATLADVDLGAIRKRMAATIERARAEDPRELRRQVTILQAELAKAGKGAQVVHALHKAGETHAGLERKLRAEYRRYVDEVEAKLLGLIRERDAALKAIKGEAERMAGVITRAWSSAQKAAQELLDGAAHYKPPTVTPAPRGSEAARALLPRLGQIALGLKAAPGPAAATPRPVPPTGGHVAPGGPPSPPQGAQEGLAGRHLKILRALAMFAALGRQVTARAAIALATGYSAGGGAFAKVVGELSTGGWIRYPAPASMALTEKGQAAVGALAIDGTPTHEGVMAIWRAKLKPRHLRILDPLVKAWPDAVPRNELARLAHYEHGGGAYAKVVGELSTLGLLIYPAPGQVRAADELFPEVTAG